MVVGVTIEVDVEVDVEVGVGVDVELVAVDVGGTVVVCPAVVAMVATVDAVVIVGFVCVASDEQDAAARHTASNARTRFTARTIPNPFHRYCCACSSQSSTS